MNPSRETNPMVQTLRRRLPDAGMPLALFAAMTSGGKKPNSILLESAEPTSRQSQRSLLVVSAALEVICRGPHVRVTALNSNGQSLLPSLSKELTRFKPQAIDHSLEMNIPTASQEWSEERRLHADSPLSVLRTILRAHPNQSPATGESILLAGLFAYDLVAQFEPLPPPTPDPTSPANNIPDYQFVLADQLVIIDHQRQHAEAMVHVFAGANANANYYSGIESIARISEIAERLSREPPAETPWQEYCDDSLESVRSNVGDDEFAATVVKLKKHIVQGDVFQIVPSRTFSIPCVDPLAAYASLRQLNPSPYLFYANLGSSILFGASPESAVKVDGPLRRVEISPIAGTRRRGLRSDGCLDQDWDSRIEAELRLDEKENAEHMMLVDLARNDVARVSKPGSRHVVDLARIDRYSHVMHLVSRVRGELRDELDGLHAYQASMNMGTLTGAPKIKAMELLRQYEAGRRGHYGGAVGYLRGDGSLDTAIVIRAALVKDGVAHVRAGAGVVYDSDPRLEADESRRKAEAVLRAVSRANASVVEVPARD